MTPKPGAIGGRTRSASGVSRGGTMTADERPPAVIDVETDRTIHVGGKVYNWPSRVAIVGYGLKNGVSPRVNRLVQEVEDFSQQHFRWEVRLNHEMPSKTL